jgi:AbrB family looped-hinge helix DNA binding protein
MDSAGRLVIPSEIRREAALEHGTPLEVRWRDGVIEIEPQALVVTLERQETATRRVSRGQGGLASNRDGRTNAPDILTGHSRC